MVRSILAIPATKLDSIDAPKLTAYEQNIKRDIIEILTPFEEATDFAQVENCPSADYILPCIRGLEHQLNSMVSKYHSSFVIALQCSLVKRMAVYDTKKDYIVAAILDPDLNYYGVKMIIIEKKRVMSIIEAELAEVANPISVSVPTSLVDEEAIASDGSEPPKKKRCLFTFMDEKSENSHESK
jgi:hypothetical protein